MNIAQIFVLMQDHTKAVKRAAVPLLVAMMIGVYILVYYTGGIKYVFSHSMYIPIILAALIFGVRGGIIASGLGGFILGPLMPIDVITKEPQDAANWLFRACIFVVVGILIGAASDSTQKYLNHIKWIMNHDIPSGLPNRTALINVMQNTDPAQVLEKYCGLAIVSFDNGAEVDSAYGPEIINGMIKELTNRFNKVFDDKLTLYRTNTHQLGILIPINEKSTNEALLDKLTEISKYPFAVGDISIHGDVRIGYAELSNLEEGQESYLRKAEIALSTASRKSQNWVFFTPDLESETTKDNLRLLSELKAALECDELSMHYQPKVNIASGEMQGVEALMRWQHPKLGLIQPSVFIPRTEESVLIDAVTEWAIDAALAQHVEWKKHGVELPISVNVSPKNLLQPGFVDTVLRLLDRYQIKGNVLELELTESALMLEIEHTIAKLMELSDINVIISIDDFGTGYSSLYYLNNLPATTIKIDRSFIRTLSADSGSKHIVQATVDLAHGLEMNVVAEGVENQSAYDLLASLGCDTAQGYFISHPLPGSEILDWRKSMQKVAV